jgi:hypothetical protein
MAVKNVVGRTDTQKHQLENHSLPQDSINQPTASYVLRDCETMPKDFRVIASRIPQKLAQCVQV